MAKTVGIGYQDFWDLIRDDIFYVDKDGIIIEFKVHDPEEEGYLQDTVWAALGQIEKKQYAQELVGRGISEERIRRYGFAFEGKKVLIGEPTVS